MPKTGLEIFCIKPPAKAPWAKVIAQLNREFLLNHMADLKTLRRVAVIKRKKNKPMKTKLLCLLPLVAIAGCSLTGCSSTNITKLVGALSKDPATCVVKVTTIYGTISYTRVGVMTNETASVNSDGSVTIKTNP